IGLGVGTMMTPSVNVVQSSFPEHLQGEISGLSRSVSNLGSSLGAAIAGTILVAQLTSIPQRSYALALIVLAVIALGGLAAGAMLGGGGLAAGAVIPAVSRKPEVPAESVPAVRTRTAN